MQNARRSGSMLAVFLGILGSLGGMFETVAPEKKSDGKPKQKPWARWWMPSERTYYYDHNNSLRRRVPKRDKSISARQWKKRVKLARRMAKLDAQLELV